MKQHNRIDMDKGLLVNTITNDHTPVVSRVDNRLNIFETTEGIGSIKIRFTLNAIPTSNLYYQLLQTSVYESGQKGFVMGIGLTVTYANCMHFGVVSVGTSIRINVHSLHTPLTVGSTYDFVVIKIGAENRMYLDTVDLPFKFADAGGASSGAMATTNPLYIAGAVNTENNLPNDGNTTVHEIAIFNTEIDKIGGVIKDDYITAMYTNGNWIPTELHPYVVAHYTLQETSGSVLYDCVEQYNYAKNPVGNLVVNGDLSDTTGTNWTGYWAYPEKWSFNTGKAAFHSTPDALNAGAGAKIGTPPKVRGQRYKLSYDFWGDNR